jgi:rhamnose transport system ATP-binding protein
VTILRSGGHVVTRPAAELTPEQTVRHMVGSDLAAFFPKEAAAIGAPVLSVRGLSGAGFVEDVSFDLRAGEILGFFGLVGAGRSEVAEMLFGIAERTAGEIHLDGRAVRPRSPRDALKLGISLLPEDRHQQGLVLEFPIRANATLPILRRLANALGIVDRAAEARIATEFAKRMRVIATGIEQATDTLSGGNQQKVLFARALGSDAGIILMDDPMRGVDVGTKLEVYELIRAEAEAGRTFIWYTTEIEELNNCDHVYVMRDGQIVADIARADLTEEKVLQASFREGGRA